MLPTRVVVRVNLARVPNAVIVVLRAPGRGEVVVVAVVLINLNSQQVKSYSNNTEITIPSLYLICTLTETAFLKYHNGK
jgi:hypothetical protein